MPFRIQRVPQGLSQLLSIFGGESPQELDERVQANVDILPMYGLSQLQTATAFTVGAAEGANTDLVLNATNWTLLHGCSIIIVKTATMTALFASLQLRRQTNIPVSVAAGALGPFGATETGNVIIPFRPSTPILMPPGAIIRGVLNIIGTDATADVTVTAEFGTLG